MASPNMKTYTFQGEGVSLEVVTESDDFDLLNILMPILHQNNVSTNQIKFVKRDDGIIEIHGMEPRQGSNNHLPAAIQDCYGDDSSSAIENQEQVYMEVDATPQSLDRDDISNKRDSRLERDIHRKRLARARETEEQKSQRLEKDRKRKREARKHESDEQRAARLAKDRARVHRRRQCETDTQRIMRLQRNRDVKRRSRLREQSHVKINNNNNADIINNNHINNNSNSAANNNVNLQHHHHLHPFSASNIKQEIVPSMSQLTTHNQPLTKPIATEILTIVSL